MRFEDFNSRILFLVCCHCGILAGSWCVQKAGDGMCALPLPVVLQTLLMIEDDSVGNSPSSLGKEQKNVHLLESLRGKRKTTIYDNVYFHVF